MRGHINMAVAIAYRIRTTRGNRLRGWVATRAYRLRGLNEAPPGNRLGVRSAICNLFICRRWRFHDKAMFYGPQQVTEYFLA